MCLSCEIVVDVLVEIVNLFPVDIRIWIAIVVMIGEGWNWIGFFFWMLGRVSVGPIAVAIATATVLIGRKDSLIICVRERIKLQWIGDIYNSSGNNWSQAA